MTFLSSISRSINFTHSIMPGTFTETATVSAAVISGLYSTMIGGAVGIGYLSYKGYQHLQSLQKYNHNLIDIKMHGKESKIFDNGDVYEGPLVEGQCHGKGKIRFVHGTIYEGEFVKGRIYGKGKLTLDNGIIYEGEFAKGKFLKGKVTLPDGSIEEGNFVNLYFEATYLQGNGKVTLPDSFFYEGEFSYSGIVSTNISHLGDRLFYNLLNGLTEYGAKKGYSLGIIADYLQKNGYQDLGSALDSAHQLLRIHPNNIIQESEKIHSALNQGTPQLFPYGFLGHGMGLNLLPDPSLGFVLCEIFNSGGGLDKYHQKHERDFRKYKTMLQIKVPIESITPETIKKILRCNDFKNADKTYRHILELSKSSEIIQSENISWQTQQKRGECDLRWILVYLKNKMPEAKYKAMLSKLREDCLKAYKGSPFYQEDSISLAQCKQTMKFPNGDCYEGGTLYGRFQGEGKLTLNDGTIFEGEFSEDQILKGKTIWANGTIFEGEFVQVKPQKGKLTYADDGSSYEGYFMNGRFHGPGKRVYSDGSFYEGNFAEGVVNGMGKFTFGDNNYYQGNFMNGLFHGSGKRVFPNGSCYEGNFVKNSFVGNNFIENAYYYLLTLRYGKRF